MINFNFVQSSSRTVVESAFDLLKGKFARLQIMNVKSLTDKFSFILVFCTFHNFCIKKNSLYDDGTVFSTEDLMNTLVCIGSTSKDAELKRKGITADLYNI